MKWNGTKMSKNKLFTFGEAHSRYPPPLSTEKQQSYIAALCIDLGLDKKRCNAHIKAIIGREIKFLDDLTLPEASTVIDRFKSWKEGETIH